MRNSIKLLLYFVPLYVFEIIFISLLCFQFRLTQYGQFVFQELIPLIPGGFISDLVILFTAVPLIILGFGFLICPLITIMYYGAHRFVRVFSKEYDYKLMNMRQNIPFRRLFYRLIFPAFFALSLAMIFNATQSTSFFLQIPNNIIMQVYMASLIFIAPSFFLLAPLWILDDSGIVCHLKEDIGYRRPPETESVSRFFSNAYKGYVSITFAFSFVLLLYGVIMALLATPQRLLQDIFMITALVGFPFCLSAIVAPFCILYEKWLVKLVGFMRKHAKVEDMPYYEEKFVKAEKIHEAENK